MLATSFSFLQRLLAQSLAQLGECLPLSVAQAHAARDLLAQNTVFRDQIFIANQEFPVHRARNVG
jgi:hypothetical protein